MSDEWLYQVRINMSDKFAEIARRDPDSADIQALAAVLQKHNAKLKCQYDAFAGYVAEAEDNGTENYPLYQWTKDTIEDPVKKAKYIKAFTLYVDGDEVYAKEKADPLEADLKPFDGGEIVTRLTKHDTNPANNPQPPKKYQN